MSVLRNVVLGLLVWPSVSALAATTVNAVHRFAYGANVGWIDARGDVVHGAVVGQHYGSGSLWGANVGWISLANSQSLVRTDTLSPGPDSDADGLPDAWEYKVAGNLTTLTLLVSDADADGVSDADEYAADTDPLDPLSFLRITAFSRDGGTDEATWPVAPTRLYRLVQADDLAPSPPAWTDSGHGLMLPGGGSELTRQVVDPTATQRFYRVQAVVPLAP